MSTPQNLVEWDEHILPFQLEKSDIRGRFIRLDAVLAEALRQHNYPDAVSALLTEAAVITALIGQSIKLRWKLSLQIRGDGPIRIIATDFYGPQTEGEPARMRAYASFDADALAQAGGSPFENIGKGMFAILIDQGTNTQPYQGITPLAGGSLAKCAETYFAQSEQIPTRFEVTLGQSQNATTNAHWRGAGMMIQHMPPPAPNSDLAEIRKRHIEEMDENWSRANILLDTVEELEMIGPMVSPPELVNRLFHQEIPMVSAAQPVKFGCTCGEDKVRQTMSIYSAKDISKMTAPNGMVTADCQFCGAHYELDPATLGMNAAPRD